METLTRDGVSLAFEDVGRGAPPVLLIHDLGSDHTALQRACSHFRERHRVVTVDLRGHGDSDRLSEPYTLAGFADDLAWLCRELGLYRPLAVGYGLGAMIAAELASRYPDLLAAVGALDAPAEQQPETRAGRNAVLAAIPHLAATRDNLRDADGPAALGGCPVPVFLGEPAVDAFVNQFLS